MAIFHDVKKKKRFIFFITRFFLIFVNKELKIFFITSEGFFKWQRKTGMVTFKQAYIKCR